MRNFIPHATAPDNILSAKGRVCKKNFRQNVPAMQDRNIFEAICLRVTFTGLTYFSVRLKVILKC